MHMPTMFKKAISCSTKIRITGVLCAFITCFKQKKVINANFNKLPIPIAQSYPLKTRINYPYHWNKRYQLKLALSYPLFTSCLLCSSTHAKKGSILKRTTNTPHAPSWLTEKKKLHFQLCNPPLNTKVTKKNYNKLSIYFPVN
jgi:hypothetical protein